jgi:acyl-CoA oxidase
VHALLVPIRDEDGNACEGVRIEDCGVKLGLNGVDNGRLWFDHVRVPRENLLDKLAQVHEDGTYFSAIENPTRRFFTMLGTLIQGRISVGGAGLSASKVALTIAVRRALERRQFGAPGAEQEALLMDYRTHQRRLLLPLAKTYALSLVQLRLVKDLHAVFTNPDAPERERRELETLAAGVKAVATWHATDTIQACREACGGAGYLRSSRFASLKADTDVFTTFEGDNTILLQLAAKNLLTDYKDAFGELDKLGMAQFVAGQALSVLGERVPLRKLADSLRPGRDDEGDLLDHKTQLDLFRWRHEHLLAGAARRLKGGMDAKKAPFDVLVDTQDHVLEVARSWVDLVILESFVDAAKGNALLSRLCSLYALSVVEAERGYYQEHGRLSGARSKAVVKAVNALCGELRPHARDLVDAFGVPESTLGDARAVANEQERVPA